MNAFLHKIKTFALVGGLALLLGGIGQADAAPIQVGLGAFSGSETVLDFDGVGLGQPITNNFVAQPILPPEKYVADHDPRCRRSLLSRRALASRPDYTLPLASCMADH